MTPAECSLFEPVTLGDIRLPNRIIMASMSRARTNNAGLMPNDLQVEYYRRRASAGLLMTEGTWPSREAIGAPFVPGLYSEAQVEGWKWVTDAVHTAGGRIAVQLGHAGAASHPSLLEGKLPLGPSAAALNHQIFIGEMVETPVAREMTRDDVRRTIDDFARATRNARVAGFDGVELHGTVGFLIPQFLNARFNQREDEYGGSVENRVRFPLEILQAMIAEWSPGRVGMKVSPAVGLGAIQPTTETLPTYEFLVGEASRLELGWMQFQDAAIDLTGTPVEALTGRTSHHFRNHFSGSIIANGGLDKARAEAVLSAGAADAVAIGADYLANPDLVERLKEGRELAPVLHRDFWYGGDALGYLDIPAAN